MTLLSFSEGHALIVGVGGDLPNTVDDATGMAEMLRDAGRCAYPPDQVHLLTGEDAGREQVLAALEELSQSTDPQSTVVVYFSGHGYRVTSPTGEFYYLLPHGYDLERLYRSAIGGDKFVDRLRTIPAQKLLVLLDCCHAGGVGEAKAAGLVLTKSPVPPETQHLLAEGSGRVLIASSREDELSFAGKPYSAFTLALIEALCGTGVARQDGLVRVADVALHARQVVPERTRGRQHPILHFEHADNFVLAYYAGGEVRPKGVPFVGEPQIEPEPGAWTRLDQCGQTVHGPQTVVTGGTTGPVLSGEFGGPVAVGDGEAVDLRGAQGVVYRPTGSVEQQVGNRVVITGDGNVVGDGSSSRVVKVEGKVRDSAIITAGRDIVLGALGGEELDIAPSPEARRLHRILRIRLDREELRTLCFDLGVNYDDLGGEGLSGKARQLVLFLQKRNRLTTLVEWLRRERPDIQA